MENIYWEIRFVSENFSAKFFATKHTFGSVLGRISQVRIQKLKKNYKYNLKN